MKIDVNDSITGTVEYPPGKSFHSGHRLLVSGWVYAKDGSDIDIYLYSKGKELGRGTWAITRYDIFKEFKNESAYESGFYVLADIRELPYGENEIDIIGINNSKSILIKRLTFKKTDASKNNNTLFHKFLFLLHRKFNIQNPGVIYADLVENKIPFGAAPGSMKKGAELLEFYIETSQLEPTARVLEVGCGLGRFSLPLTRYLETGGGSYTGLEVLPHAVDYLKKNISPRFKNFDVSLAEVYNKRYNPNCNTKAADYIFPYKNDNFDFVFLQSVFTHITITDARGYLAQIARVLKKGGRCLLTYFILNEATEKLIKQGLANRKFKYQFDGFRADSEKVPEDAIAYDESYLRNLFSESGLAIIEPISFGSWRGDKKGIPVQDVIIAEKI